MWCRVASKRIGSVMALQLWKRLTQATTIHESLRPLVCISFMGLAPFHMKAERDVHTSFVAFILGIIHFVFFVMCFVLSMYEGDSIIGYFFQTSITKLGDFTLSLSGIIVMSAIFNSALLKRRRIIRIITYQIVVDEIFSELGFKTDYTKVYRYSAVISLIIMLLNFAYLCVSYWLLRSAQIAPSFVVFVSFALPHINVSLMVFKFLCTTHMARGRFAMMNEILQDILNTHVDRINSVQISPTHATSFFNPYKRRSSVRPMSNTTINTERVCVINMRQDVEHCLRKLENVHNILCDICYTIEQYFAFPLLSIIAISFLFILFDDFYILDALMTPNRVERVEADEFFTFFFIQLLWYVIIIVLIVESSNSTIKESQNSAALVHKLLSVSEDTNLRERLVYFSLQLSHRPVRFTAAGLFALDRTLIFTITGAATCYLIILLQFRAMPYHNLNNILASNSSS